MFPNGPTSPLNNLPPGYLTEYPTYSAFCEWVNSQFGGATQWNWQLFDTLYRTSWVAEKCVTTIPDDICDKWREFDHPDPEVVKIRTAYEEENDISGLWREYLTTGRLYGGSALIPILKSQFNDEHFQKEFFVDSVKKDDLHGFQVLTKYDFAPLQGINRDIFQSPRVFGDYIYYKIIRIQTIMGSPTSGITQEPINSMNLPTIHVTRMIKYFGKPLFYYQKFFSGGWGDSVLVPLLDKIGAVEEAFHLIFLYMALFNIDEYGIPNLGSIISSGGGAALAEKWKQFSNKVKSAKTRFKDINDTLTRNQLTSIQNIVPVFNSLVQFCVGSTGIPITRILGTGVSGLNATGDNELSQYYELVEQQAKRLSPQMRVFDEIVERSLFGKKMDIKYKWKAKHEMSEKERAEVGKVKADTFAIYLQNKVMTPKVVGENIQADFSGIDENYLLTLDEDFLSYENDETGQSAADSGDSGVFEQQGGSEKEEGSEAGKAKDQETGKEEGSDLETEKTDSED